MDEIYMLLAEYGNDSELEIISIKRSTLTLALYLATLRGEKYLITLENVAHLDMCPYVHLGRIDFGDMSLLPQDYLKTRFEYEEFRVMKITEQDDQYFHYVIYQGKESLKIIEDNDPILKDSVIGQYLPRY